MYTLGNEHGTILLNRSFNDWSGRYITTHIDECFTADLEVITDLQHNKNYIDILDYYNISTIYKVKYSLEKI